MKLSPFVSITTIGGLQLSLGVVSKFSYKYSEEEDDVAEVEVDSNNPYIADHTDFQEGNVLKITWGYLDGVGSDKVTRIVYIFDTKTEYTSTGVKLTLTCHEKFAATKMDVAKPQNSSKTPKDPSTLIIQTTVLENIRVNDGYTEQFMSLFDEATKLNPREVEAIQQGINDPNYNNNYLRSGVEDHPDTPYKPRIVNDGENLNITIYNGNLPTFRGLRDYLNKLPGGPYIVNSRDDYVIIQPRNFTQNVIANYSYAADPGELIEFTPETKNRTKSSSSEKVDTVGWDSSNKTPINERSVNTSTGQSQKLLWRKLQEANPLPGSPEWMTQMNNQGTVRANPTQPDQKPKVKISQIGGEALKEVAILRAAKLAREDELKNFILGPETTPITEEEELPGKTIVLGSESPDKVKALAENLRENAQLENNPATASMVGNPALQTGKIINIQGVSVRHQGQYYIKECTHTIDDSGYLVNIESMVRPGIKENKTKLSSQSTQAPVKSLKDEDPAKLQTTLDRFNRYHQYKINTSSNITAEQIDDRNQAIDDRLENLGIFPADQS